MAMASSSVQQSPPAMRSVSSLTRFALALTASLLSIFARVGRAIAAERTVRAAAATTSSVSFALSGNTIKWSVVTLALGSLYVFRREETPILTETVMPDEPNASSSLDVDGRDAAVVNDAAAPPSAPADDASLNAALFARMQQLASERESGDEDASNDDAPPTSTDSTDSWGVGNTAVLEPPRDGASDPPSASDGGLLDGEPPVDFPTGYPLVDGGWDEADTQPAASDDQIQMLQRMFGSAAAEE